MENSEKNLEWKMQFREFSSPIYANQFVKMRILNISRRCQIKNSQTELRDLSVSPKKLSTSISLQSSLWFTVSFGAIVCHGVTIRERW